MVIIIAIIFTLCLIFIVYKINKNGPINKDSQNKINTDLIVANVDLNRYQGLWYEIARLPNYFEKGCVNPVAIYGLNNDGTMSIINECVVDNAKVIVNGTAYPDYQIKLPGSAQPGKFKVYFKNIPIPGEYNIIYLDQNYLYAMVGTSDRQNLWLLSRSNNVSVEKLREMINIANKYNYPTNKIIPSSNKLVYSRNN